MFNPKPVRWMPEAGSQFSDPEMVQDYACRDPFHPQVVNILRALSLPRRRILDVGCGSADLTMLLTKVWGGQVEGVDPSEAMLQMASERQPDSLKKKIRWVKGTVEDDFDSLRGEYGLVTAADSIHWTDWPRFFPIAKALMLEKAYLVIVERFKGQTTWKMEEKALVSRYYTEKDQGKYDPVDEIVARGYFRFDGQHISPPMPIVKSPADYIRERHSRNGCSRARMGLLKTEWFNQEMMDLLTKHTGSDGLLRYEGYTKLRWGIIL